MRTQSIALLVISAFAFSAYKLGPVLPAQAQAPQVQVQTPQIQAKRITLSEEKAISRMQADDTSATAVLPLPDLTIKGMCLEHDRKTGWSSLRVILANIGKEDAGPFELGIVFTSPGGTDNLMTDKMAALKAGEEQSHDYSPICCGWSPTNLLVETSAKFRAIADPRYYKHKGIEDIVGYEVKPVIRESNEKNNELTVSKSEVKPCALPLQQINRPQTPQTQVMKPSR